MSSRHLYYNYEKYPLSPLKPRFLLLIEQYLPNISDPVYSVHQSFMWFLWLNWRKSTFYPVTAPNDSKCWPIVTSSIQEPTASNCDVTMTDCFHMVAVENSSQHSGRPRTLLALIFFFFFNFVTPRVSTRSIAKSYLLWKYLTLILADLIIIWSITSKAMLINFFIRYISDWTKIMFWIFLFIFNRGPFQ